MSDWAELIPGAEELEPELQKLLSDILQIPGHQMDADFKRSVVKKLVSDSSNELSEQIAFATALLNHLRKRE